MQVIEDNLLRAQDIMKSYADKKRCEREFFVGDMVYLKIQPYIYILKITQITQTSFQVLWSFPNIRENWVGCL